MRNADGCRFWGQVCLCPHRDATTDEGSPSSVDARFRRHASYLDHGGQPFVMSCRAHRAYLTRGIHKAGRFLTTISCMFVCFLAKLQKTAEYIISDTVFLFFFNTFYLFFVSILTRNTQQEQIKKGRKIKKTKRNKNKNAGFFGSAIVYMCVFSSH